jgi:hypothetical protein
MALDVVYNGGFIGVVNALSPGYTAATDAQAIATLAAIKATANTFATALTASTADFTPIAVAAGDYENLLTAIVEGLFSENPSVGTFTAEDFATLVDAAVEIFNATASDITHA